MEADPVPIPLDGPVHQSSLRAIGGRAGPHVLVVMAVTLVWCVPPSPLVGTVPLDTVHVAPPTGETAADRARILTALDEGLDPGAALPDYRSVPHVRAGRGRADGARPAHRALVRADAHVRSRPGGHRLRIAIAGADADMFRRIPEEEMPELTIHLGGVHASHVVLPVVPR